MSDQAAQAPRPARPKVVQPKPTNKASVAAAAAAGPIAGPSTGAAPPQQPGRPTTSAPRPLAPKIIAPTTASSSSSSTSSLLVQNTQRGNPLLKSIRNVAWEFADIPCDYQLGPTRGALFLSLKYHRLHPEYVHDRIGKLKGSGRFEHRLLLVQCDVPDPQSAIKELTKTTLVNGMTMIVAWTPEEAGRYLEHYKVYENKPPDLIRERRKEDFMAILTDCLTSIRRVNRTDVKNLMTRFGSLRNLSRASAADLADLNGFGEIKVRLLMEAFATPFRVGEKRTYRERREARLGRAGADDGDGNGDDDDEIEDDEDGLDALRSGAAAAAQGSHVGGVARGLQEGAEAAGEAGTSSATKRRRVEEEDGGRLDSTTADAAGAAPIDVTTEDEDLTLDLNDEDLAALDAAEKLGGATAAVDPAAEDGEAGDAGEDGHDDFGDEVNLDELTAEEREELRQAMRMSMAL